MSHGTEAEVGVSWYTEETARLSARAARLHKGITAHTTYVVNSLGWAGPVRAAVAEFTSK